VARPPEHLAEQQRTLGRYLAALREATGLYQADIARAVPMIGVQRGDANQLVTYADAALEIAVQTGSGFIGRKLRELQSHLAPLFGNSEVRQLDQWIMDVCRGVR
jgi:hypothetical protein